jgi:hypothetical protein
MSKLPTNLEEELQHFFKLLYSKAIFLKQGSKGLCSSYGITLGQGEDKVKVEKVSQELPSRIEFPSIKVEQHASHVNLRGKRKVDQNISMFIRFLKTLLTIMVEKEEGKHETREEVERHLHISIPNPPKTNFQSLNRFYKKINSKYLYFRWIQKSISRMLEI